MDGTVTPHVLAYEQRLSNFKRAGESGEEGGSAASIAIAESLVARVEPSLGCVAHVEITNKKRNTVGVCWPQCCRSTKSPPEFL